MRVCWLAPRWGGDYLASSGFTRVQTSCSCWRGSTPARIAAKLFGLLGLMIGRNGRGTIIVDLERGCPVAMLESRESEVVQAWLEAHPGIEIMTRDRANAYAEACSKGAPQAEQVLDLWHLLKNLFEAVERSVARQHGTIKAAAKRLQQTSASIPAPPSQPSDQAGKPSNRKLELRSIREEKRRKRFEEVKMLYARGWSKRRIAKEIGLSRATVIKYLSLDALPPHAARGKRGSLLDEYKSYLHHRLGEGCTNAAQLYREIRQQGFTGGITIVKSYVQQRREQQETTATRLAGKPSITENPSSRTLGWWLMSDPEELPTERRDWLGRLLSALPDLKREIELARVGWQALCERQLEKFVTWMNAVKQIGNTELKRFVKGLKHDLQPVLNTLRYTWTNGPTEGHVNRIKTIKRSMYGRANFDLLSAKVLYQG